MPGSAASGSSPLTWPAWAVICQQKHFVLGSDGHDSAPTEPFLRRSSTAIRNRPRRRRVERGAGPNRKIKDEIVMRSHWFLKGSCAAVAAAAVAAATPASAQTPPPLALDRF